jgi:hypothetical protein
MGQQVRLQQAKAWRSGDGQKLWLSTLIAAMEQVSREDVRATPCDGNVLSALRLQLARPASPYPHWPMPYGSDFSLRN